MLKLSLDQTAFDALTDQQKSLYVEKDGNHILDIEGGVVPLCEFDKLKTENSTLLGQVYGPDGKKSYREMFEGSQTANQAIRKERDAFETDLKKWQALGTLEDLQRSLDELEELRKKGGNMDEAQKQITALKADIRKLTDERDQLNTRYGDLEKERNELADFKTKAKQQADFASAQTQINEAVARLEGANKPALTRSLIGMYKNGELALGEDGKLFAPENNQTLDAFAAYYMKLYRLYDQPAGVPGGATPPLNGGHSTNNEKVTAKTLADTFRI